MARAAGGVWSAGTWRAARRRSRRKPAWRILGAIEQAGAGGAAALAMDFGGPVGDQFHSVVRKALCGDAAQGDLDLESFGAKLRYELRTPLNAIIG